MERNTQVEQLHEKRLKKYEESLREFQDNMKHNNIRITGIPEGEEKGQGIETMFEKIMTENFPNLDTEKNHASSGSTENPYQEESKEANSKTYYN